MRYLYLLLLCVGCAVALEPTPKPIPADTRLGRWQQDLDYLELNFPRLQLMPWQSLPEAQWKAEMGQLKTNLPHLDDESIQLELWRIMNLFRNVHISVNPNFSSMQSLPVRFEWFLNQLYVVAAREPYKALIGQQVLAINNTSIDTLRQKIVPYVSFENPYGFLANSLTVMHQLPILQRLGLGGDSLLLKTTLSEQALDVKNRSAWVAPVLQSPNRPLFMQRGQENYWFTQEGNIAYFKYNLCRDDTGQLFGVIQNFIGLTKRPSIEKIVVDLRGNKGGNSNLLAPLLRYLRQRSEGVRKKLFVVSDRITFSSGFLNLLELRNLGAVHLGEASGQRPYHIGEVKSFYLPNSGLQVIYSTKVFAYGAPSEEALEPMRQITPSIESYLALEDPVFTWIKEN